jgi:hypothetical protein
VKLSRAEAEKLSDQLATDALPRELLTVSNPKTAKGERAGYLTAALHLAPAMVSGRNVCPHSTAGCADACLNTAGRGAMSDPGRAHPAHAPLDARPGGVPGDAGSGARAPRTARGGAGDAPCCATERAERPTVGAVPGQRGGETFPHVFAAFPGVVFYDYTKWPIHKRRVEGIENYSLTFSLAEDNDERAADALRAGVNVAVVFAGELPERFSVAGVEAPVIDGDANDLRFTDPRGCVVGLSAKGRALHDRSGFVRTYHPSEA